MTACPRFKKEGVTLALKSKLRVWRKVWRSESGYTPFNLPHAQVPRVYRREYRPIPCAPSWTPELPLSCKLFMTFVIRSIVRICPPHLFATPSGHLEPEIKLRVWEPCERCTMLDARSCGGEKSLPDGLSL